MGKNTTDAYAVVTGASRGLGKAFALELARRKINMILVSLPGEDLKSLTAEISEREVNAVPYEMDLTNKAELVEFTAWVNKNFKVEILINNAGIGGTCRFLDSNIDLLDQIIQLNVRSTTLLIHQLLPNLLQQKRAYVLNISSLAALSPIAYKTVYPASKVFIHNFTRGLQQEFKDTNVSFSVVNPGPMETNGDVSQRIRESGFWPKIINLYPDKVAAMSLNQMFKGKKVIKLNWLHRLSLTFLKLPVGIKMYVLSRFFEKENNIKKP